MYVTLEISKYATHKFKAQVSRRYCKSVDSRQTMPENVPDFVQGTICFNDHVPQMHHSFVFRKK